MQSIIEDIKSMDKDSYRKSVIDDINKSMERDGLSQRSGSINPDEHGEAHLRKKKKVHLPKLDNKEEAN